MIYFYCQVTPTTVTDIFQQIKGRRTKDIESVQANGAAPLPSQEVLNELYAIAPNAAFFTSVMTPSIDNPPTSKTTDNKYPQLLSTLQQTDNNDIDDLCNKTIDSYTVSQYQAENLEVATRNQAISSLWYQHRMGRITASKAHDVLVRKETTPAANLVKRIAGYSTYDLSKKQSVKWGVDHEDECRQAYTNHQQNHHLDLTCSPCGFFIHTSHPFLGVSPDGIVNCTCCGRGTIEVKCPFKHKDVTVPQAAKSDKNFCLDANLTLKTSHRYFTQVQMQMFITNCQYCDFVVYTKCQPEASMVIVRVPIDLDFCHKLIHKCENFFKSFVIRELLTRELENEPTTNNNDRVDNNNNNANEKSWCICSEPEYGRMIRCDGDQCPYEWFHYKCVNIRRKPRGKWFCASCEI